MTYYYKLANAFVFFPLFIFISFGASISHSENIKLDLLLQELKTPVERSSKEVERDIWAEWSKSGSIKLDSLLNRGRSFMADKKFDNAIYIFDKLINEKPTFAEAWNARATAYYLQGKFDKSISDINEVLSLNPSHFGALAGLGSILETLGYFDAAKEALQKANEINPKNQNIKKSLERVIKKANDTSL